jgi:hypothetical protein
MKEKYNPFLANSPLVIQVRSIRRTASGEMVESDPFLSKRVWVRLENNKTIPVQKEFISKTKLPKFKEYKFKTV